ncbi:hypothetical protein KR215_003686 [Drosophila sulfurigaster]|uniref:Uncharacterized protein LOC117564468 n=1 Tax=Drosophila albomicans TaxID=7291 RepID=A0A6P8WMK5_DROAB|nr:uncharacterized protein LOC117564468 [Drosophila albomicans]XP_060666370.1 uncharacterized protein LOC132798507 [Drosophila nasuta]XP_062122230.1 uncharacterized protein LOC133836003 [Drosophila sulfurigaster albostrigata]KAH8392234.1 hypothetical protein KR215_003686 [Drosophila sulfurigaster]
MATLGKSKEWSRAIICRPKDNLTTEAGLRAQKYTMVPTIEKEESCPSMAMIIGNEYARMWLKDRDEFQAKTDLNRKKKVIKNDFDWWLKLRKTTKCFCPI